ncbi:Alcohol dehydrogenase [Pigmentiphaga humi]|uniref:Alcohol dehydrogenase n=1 Tax=Pigmentiphaga humi TaxID=2478468 RepID=A0A3P4AZW9_9BURK|nr:iron-containing alcohol dehydrogenase [Pigmentiphaga humi]VCU69030.1 Alcohol dehydrogenase [Pigmentiphaga humi]
MTNASAAPLPVPALTAPRTLYAAGAIRALPAELESLGVRRPLIVTDRGLVAAGVAAKVEAACGDGAAAARFDGVTENPLYADVDAGAAYYAAQVCDGVIAVGGGSVIDTAKMIALLATNAGSAADYLGKPNVRHGPAAPLVVVPTTAGTGSEASPSAGIHPDAATASVGMNSRHLVPRLAVLDPELTVSLPRRLTAATGIDALSHCIEGYLSNREQPLGKAIALDGIARAARSLRRAVEDGADLHARGEMMLAAFAGGVSIGMGLGPAHAVAIVCSDQGFHHGVLSGIGLVATLDATAEHVPDRMAAVSAAFGLPASASLAEGVAALMRELGLPTTLAELGYTAPDLQALAAAAERSHFNLSAPFRPQTAHYADFLTRSLYPETKK